MCVEMSVSEIYKNIQTPNSPLSPLPTMSETSLLGLQSTMMFLTPQSASAMSSKRMKNRRRTFTPIAHNFMSPIGVSPIPQKTPNESALQDSFENSYTPENKSRLFADMKHSLSVPKRATGGYHSAGK